MASGQFLSPLMECVGGGPRTNNHLKVYCNELKRVARKVHPMFSATEIMKQEQTDTEGPIALLARGAQAPRRKVSQRMRLKK